MSWWQRFLNWLLGNEPGDRKEQVEDWITANQAVVNDFMLRQNGRKNAQGHYFQRLKGWGKPSDNPDNPENDFAGKLPVWCDISVDVWEAPGEEKGWTIRLWVTEVDTSIWVLSVDSKDGSKGWTEQKPWNPL